MSSFLIAIVTVIYAGVCLSALWDGNNGLAVMFGAYALANVGVLMMTTGS